jgi:integrase
VGFMAVKWTQTDELNWAADRLVLRKLKDRSEEPSEWLAAEFEELSERRKAAKPRRPQGEGGVYQRGDGMWCISVELPEGLDGKRRRKVICRKDKAAVVAEMRKVKSELAKRGDLATSSTTVAKWMAHWMDDIAPQTIRPKTLAGYRTVVDGYIVPTLGRKRLEKLSAQDVRSLHTIMQATPKDLSLRGKEDLPPGTVMLSSTYALLAHNALSTALKVALREGKIGANPCDLVDRPRKRVAEQKALDTPQAVKLLKYLGTLLDGDDEQGKQDGALWATYLLTGARRGEILGLEADRVGDVLDLSWQLQRITDISKVPADWEYRKLGSTLYLTRPKSNAGWRIIPLVEPLRAILRLQVGDRKDGLVFTRNGRPWDPDGATKAWSAVLAKAGLPGDVVLHGARHTTVELLYAAKVPEDIIQAIVGHSTRAMTRSYKTRTDSARLIEGMESLSALFRRQIEA